jgi:LL-diaminopimelate aminotransferase
LFDAAYEAFIRDDSLPHSIYEIEGAKDVAVEFRSYSKTAGFTGTRCAYTVVPKACMIWDSQGNRQSLREMWFRRQSTKFNGVSYPVQRAAEAVYSSEGQQQIREQTDYYLCNARRIRETFSGLGYSCVGGINSPYIWINTGMNSWEFFDTLLNNAAVVCTPGAGFGSCGREYIRISAFNSSKNVEKALKKITAVLGK